LLHEHPPRRAPDAPTAIILATAVIQAAGFAVVLAALPYPVFQLDRYTFPKELVLSTAALAASLLCLGAARRLSIGLVDLLLTAFLAVSALSALLAVNGWLAWRAFGVSLAGVALFWCGRSIARAGLRRALLTGLAAAVVLGAVTGLVQAYGLVTTDLASLTRAPGGTFGNRNFMAHLTALGLPVLLCLVLSARSRAGFTLGAVAVALCAAALVLSRSRAAWLGAGASTAFLLVEGLGAGRLWREELLRRRVRRLAGVAAAGLLLALALPNRLNWRSDSPYLESLTGIANDREGSGRGRLIQYGNTLRIAVEHPVLGVGPGNWPVQYPRYMSPGDPSFDADDFIPTNPWPSSDWMAMVSERGFLATALLAAAGGLMALGAWMRARQAKGKVPALTDLALVATLVGAAVMGAFDAVLLLPPPALFTWTIAGALAASARPVREPPLSRRTRRHALVVSAAVGLAFLWRSAAQTVAMGVFDPRDRGAMETAAAVDPASFRIRMLLARSWAAAGRCARGVPHAAAARELFPNYPAPARLLRACGARTPR
jgi:O-antigen ligase